MPAFASLKKKNSDEIESFSEHEAPTKMYAPSYELLQESVDKLRRERIREGSKPHVKPKESELSAKPEEPELPAEPQPSTTRELPVLAEAPVPTPRRSRLRRFLAVLLFAALFTGVLAILALEASVKYGFPSPNETLLDMAKNLIP